MIIESQIPTSDEITKFSLKTISGIELGFGQADPVANIAKRLEAAYPGYLILVQSGKFLHGFDRSAYALFVLKSYKMKLVGTATDPHIRVGFPVTNFKRRLWTLMDEFGIPYVVSLGTAAAGRECFVASHVSATASVLSTVSEQVVAEVIEGLKQREHLKKAGAAQLLSNPEAAGFKWKDCARELDTKLLQDLLKMSRDVRATYGENVRACMARIMHGIFAYGYAASKALVLHSVSADIDLLKHYLVQAAQLSKLRLNYEDRVGLAAELGRLTGGLMRSAGTAA